MTEVTSADPEAVGGGTGQDVAPAASDDAASANGMAPADGVAPFLIDHQVELQLPKGSRVVLVSDLHLPAVATPTSTAVADEIAGVLGGCVGPAGLVIAGDGFEMLAGPPDVGMILDAHPQFTEAITRFAQADNRHVIVLSGNHDGQLAWDGLRPPATASASNVGIKVYQVRDGQAGSPSIRIVNSADVSTTPGVVGQAC